MNTENFYSINNYVKLYICFSIVFKNRRNFTFETDLHQYEVCIWNIKKTIVP